MAKKKDVFEPLFKQENKFNGKSSYKLDARICSVQQKTQRLEILELKMTESRKKGSSIKAIISMILIDNETYSEDFF